MEAADPLAAHGLRPAPSTKMRESADITKIAPALVRAQGIMENPPRNRTVQVRSQGGAQEEWRPVEGCPGYWVSAFGRVQGKRGEMLKPAFVRGYPAVTVVMLDGRRLLKKVHRLVCEAFHGPSPPSPPKYVVAHLDGTRTNNRAENLIWATQAENKSHEITHGTRRSGEHHPQCKLSLDQVRLIRAAYATAPRTPKGRVAMGFRHSLAQRFGVSVPLVAKIIKGSIWRCP